MSGHAGMLTSFINNSSAEAASGVELEDDEGDRSDCITPLTPNSYSSHHVTDSFAEIIFQPTFGFLVKSNVSYQ